ncbi:MAG: glutathione S-transferase family protein [Alphaproteobacteria bacterium]
MESLKFYGPRVSTYCRICEVVAEEKGVPWENIPTDSKDPAHRARHPFGRAPALEYKGEYGDVKLYEALAIATWIDGSFGAPNTLQPQDPLARAHMLRWVNIVDHYLFPVIEHEFVMPWVVARLVGAVPDRERAQKSIGPIGLLLDIPQGELADGRTWLAGDDFSFADIWLAATLEGLAADQAGRDLISHRPALEKWLSTVRARKSWQATTPDLSTFPGFKNFVGGA